MNLEDVKRLLVEGSYEFSSHAQQQRLEEGLDIKVIEDAIIRNGEILEDYPGDPRGESCLIVAFTTTRPIHAVVGWTKNGDNIRGLRVITVYVPQSPKWVDARTRGA